MGQRAADGPRPGGDDPSFGRFLARLRRRAGLTGHELAYRIGVSQPTISRIENDRSLPPPDVVDSLARALGANDADIATLRDLAAQQPGDLTDWTIGQGAAAVRQRYVAALEADTKEYRVFQAALVTGLLQTAEYARTILLSVHETQTAEEDPPTAKAVSEAVSARIARQEILADTRKRFDFVLAESALSNRLCRPAEMVTQIQRIRDVAEQDNVSVRIVPADATLFFPPYHGFELLDRSRVIVDLFNTSLTVTGRKDVGLYRRVFEDIRGRSTEDIGPVLDRYLYRYLDLARA